MYAILSNGFYLSTTTFTFTSRQCIFFLLLLLFSFVCIRKRYVHFGLCIFFSNQQNKNNKLNLCAMEKFNSKRFVTQKWQTTYIVVTGQFGVVFFSVEVLIKWHIQPVSFVYSRTRKNTLQKITIIFEQMHLQLKRKNSTT